MVPTARQLLLGPNYGAQWQNLAEQWDSVDSIPRLAFFICLMLVGVATAMHIFRAYRINYLYIFDIPARHQLTHF